MGRETTDGCNVTHGTSTKWNTVASTRTKSDTSEPEFRSRHVVQESRRKSTIPQDDVAATTSATPPLGGLAMSMPVVVLQFMDVSRPHPICNVPRENVYIEALEELGLDPSQSLRLKRCWYRTCDARQAFEFAVSNDLEVNNFSQRAYSPCVYRHKTHLHCTRPRLRGTWSRSGP